MAFTFSCVEVCLVTLFTFCLGYILLRKKRDPRFPPGPPSLPFIGNLLQLGSHSQNVFLKWAEEYGPVFSFKMGSIDVIMLNDAKIIKEVFAEASAAGRSSNPVILALSNGYYGLVFHEGPHWEQLRRFTVKTLRSLGFGKSSFEGIVLEECNALCKYFEKRLDKPISGQKLFRGPVVNALWNIISGERNDWDGEEEPTILKYAKEILDAMHMINKTGLIFAPPVRHIAPNYFGWTEWLTCIAKVNSVTNQSIKEHAAKLNPNSPQDFIDYCLIEMQNETDPSSSFFKELGEKNVKALIPDLFLAGSETTAHSLSWLILHLSHHQEVLKKLQHELDTVIGQGRQPSVADRPNLPYTEATIMEILRRTAVVNNGIPHRMHQDAVISGYFFPENATVISNIYHVHNDPKTWGDPENFRPERFLSEDGTKVVRHDAYIPFASGKRVCLGESLAKDSLFLFLTCIAQKFDIKAAPGSHPDILKDVDPKNKMINEPGPFEFVVSLRKF